MIFIDTEIGISYKCFTYKGVNYIAKYNKGVYISYDTLDDYAYELTMTMYSELLIKVDDAQLN